MNHDSSHEEQKDLRRVGLPPDAPYPGRTRTCSVRPRMRRGLPGRALAQAFEFMEFNLSRRLTLGDIAEAACVSRFHFARLFRVSTGHSPMQYLAKLRIERAKALLSGGGDSVCTIADALGFCDQSHFTRVFRRSVGMTPGQFAASARHVAGRG
jgi:AraC family transcriptional regulator